jgi:hypothetical protein
MNKPESTHGKPAEAAPAHHTEAHHAGAAHQDEAAAKQPAEIPASVKSEILREAVSFYLRQNFVTGQALDVCQEFIADADQKARDQLANKKAEG